MDEVCVFSNNITYFLIPYVVIPTKRSRYSVIGINPTKITFRKQNGRSTLKGK